MRTYYVILGVARDASRESVRAAYRERARQLHPDVAGESSTRSFQELSEAYAVLGDPERRRAYDAELRQEDARLAEAQRARVWRGVAVEPLIPPRPDREPLSWFFAWPRRPS